MTLSLIVSLLVTFYYLPSLLNLLSSEQEISVQDTEKSLITSSLAFFVKDNKILIFGSTMAIIFVSIVGIFKQRFEIVL